MINDGKETLIHKLMQSSTLVITNNNHIIILPNLQWAINCFHAFSGKHNASHLLSTYHSYKSTRF